MTYPEYVRSLPCGRCLRQSTPTEFHHLSGDLHQSGMGMKANDFLGMPLCLECHRSFHDARWEGDRMNEQRGILILTLIQSIKEGVLVLGEIEEDPFF